MSSSDEDDGPELDSLDISNDIYYQASRTLPVTHLKPLSDRRQRSRQIKLNGPKPSKEYYEIPIYGSKTIQHSLPAYDLWRPFYPTYMSQEKWRNFHRPKQRHFTTGPQKFSMRNRSFPIKNLTRHIYSQQKRWRFKIIKAIENGATRDEIIDKFHRIKKVNNLSAKSGELFLFEYCEEYPPVLSQPGMASNVKTFMISADASATGKSRSKSPSGPQGAPIHTNSDRQQQVQRLQDIGFYETIQEDKAKKIYFGGLKPGSQVKFIENNLYRAPIFEHKFPSCDFLIVRTRNSFYIRPIETIFTVGQIMPLVVIPEPSEKNILRSRLLLSNVHINHMFKESVTKPPTINMDKLAKRFPDYDITSLRCRMLKNGVTPFKTRYGCSVSIFQIGTSSYGQLSYLELRKSFRPEHYCIQMAMLFGLHRLRELNYADSMIVPPNDVERETEVLAAPWNTTKAIENANSNKVYLDFKSHLIDPTGPQQEGFSCVAWARSPAQEQQEREIREGTLKFTLGPNDTIGKNPLASKIRQEKLERMAIYQREAQRINEVQSKVLASDETISSSEDENDDNETDENLSDKVFEEQLSDLDRLIIGSRSMGQLNYEKEEEERRRMLADLSGSSAQNTGQSQQRDTPQGSSSKESDSNFNLHHLKNKVLKITRKYYSNEEGETFHTEIIREPRVIAMYVKQRGGSLNVNQNGLTNGYSTQHLIDSTDQDSDSLPEFRSLPRKRSSSLGPGELSRTDGIVLTISKKVLKNARPMRNTRRQSMGP